MVVKSTSIVFFGNERLVSGLKTTETPILNGLIEAGYVIAAIVSHHFDSHSRSQRELEVAHTARTHSIPVLLPDHPSEIRDQLVQMNADAAVLVAYGQIIPQDIIDIFPNGIINVHPSLLPQYRGSTPIESAIANGDKETGVSIMQLSAEMDAGPVYAQATISLAGNETKFDLYEMQVAKATALLLDTLPSILDGSLKAEPQDNDRATYSQLLSKADSLLDTNKYSAVEAERLVRAHLGFPKTKVTVMGHTLVITKVHVASEQKSPLDVVCRGGDFLAIDELIAPSGRTMSAQAFLNGYAAA